MRWKSLTLAIWIVALMLFAPVGAASAQSANGTAELDGSIVAVQQGETADLRVLLDETTEATLVLTGEGGYNVTITVTDGNGDGVVPLEFATDSIGTMRTRFVPTDDGDDYGTIEAAPDADREVSVGEYSIDVYAGHGVSGEPTDVGTLVVDEATAPPAASFEGETPLTFEAADGQTVAGTVDLEAGRNVTVRLRSTGSSSFLLSEEATVGNSGTFEATFDLADVEPPANATAALLVDGDRIAEADVDVVAQSDTGGQPGFGVAVALVSVVAAALWAGRRRA